MAKKETEKGRVGWGIKGCLGQNVLIPNQHHRELLRDFTLFLFWDEDRCPSVTLQGGSRDQLLSGVEQDISVYRRHDCSETSATRCGKEKKQILWEMKGRTRELLVILALLK